VKTLDSIVEKALSRRTFMAGAGAVAATTALAGCSNTNNTTPSPVASSGVFGDTDVLNFALNLEYLEAQFYSYAATGAGLPSSMLSAGSASPYQTVGTVTTNSSVTAVPGLTTQQQQILNEIAYEEQEHVKFLKAALTTVAVPMPNIDLTFFATLATVAGITAASPFSPFASFDAFLIGAFIFEDVGVTAYSGAAPLISATGVASGYLTAAAGILAVEAYHAAYVRTALTARAIAAGATTPTSSVYPYVGVANQVAALRATLTVGNSAAPSTTGSVETNLTVPTSTSSPSAIVAASPTTAIGFSRTVNQVHHIVYGSATVGVAKGGFFPSGTNSIFSTTTA
jgi:hypothetical protein